MKKIILLLLVLVSVTSFSQSSPKREFRGIWVATVANIDWPTKRNASSEEQKQELITQLETIKQAGFNVVFFQVRTECDALYDSKIEPWSYWLTGTQGKAPNPMFDPLQVAIEESHKRGLELHAWLNPYRASRDSNLYVQSPNHVMKQHPDWIMTFKKYSMLNPGLPQVTEYIADVVEDIVTRYDIDGLHFDDYFYPYDPITNEDTLVYLKYRDRNQSIEDWRRASINKMVKRVNGVLKSHKPYVNFSISPFGIIKNEYAGTSGFNSYDVLYNDPLTWINEKTVDMIIPQIYWEMNHEKAAYSKLLPWWVTVKDDRLFAPGLFTSRMLASDYKGNISEIFDQVRMNRATSGVSGSVHFSAVALYKNYSGFTDTLMNDLHKYPALVPRMPWLDATAPNKPMKLSAKQIDGSGVQLEWKKPQGEEPHFYVVYKSVGGKKIKKNDNSNIVAIIPATENPKFIARVSGDEQSVLYSVTALDRRQNESRFSNTVYVSVRK